MRDMAPRDMADPIIPTATEKLVPLCKANLLDGTSADELDALAWQYGIDLNGEADAIFKLVPKVLAASRNPAKVIDFDDMIWLPVVLNLPVRTYDVLMVDESQDLNRAQQALAFAAIAPSAGATIGGRTVGHSTGGRLIVVGDPNQSIYGFRGADTEAMSRMTEALRATPRGVTTLPLTVTRRCSKAVTRLAQQIVPAFECLDDAPEGVVGIAGTSDELRPEFVTGDMVLCRTNAPLIRAAFQCIRQRIPCKIQGRDIGAGLITLIKKLAPTTAPVTELLHALAAYQQAEIARIEARVSHHAVDMQLATLQDRVDCIEALTEGCDTVGDVVRATEELFANVEQSYERLVLFSSVHRAKGLESHVVHILEPEKMPHPMASLPWEQQQERNILYVAITRSAHTLIFHGTPGGVRLPKESR